MPDSRTTLTPRGAVIVGILVIACGMFPLLLGLGVFHVHASSDTPVWIVVATGGMFVLAGVAIITGTRLPAGYRQTAISPTLHRSASGSRSSYLASRSSA